MKKGSEIYNETYIYLPFCPIPGPFPDKCGWPLVGLTLVFDGSVIQFLGVTDGVGNIYIIYLTLTPLIT